MSDRHPSADEFADALVEGVGREARLRLWIHLDRPCPACWQTLADLARASPHLLEGSSREERGAPVVAALRRWLAASVEPPPIDERFAALRSVHRHLLRSAVEGPRTLGLARLVVEEARTRALADPEQRTDGLESTLEELSVDELRELAPKPWYDVHGLARIYLADEHRVAGRTRQAEELLENARSDLDQGNAEAEIWATYFETRAELDRVRSSPWLALAHLDEAAKLLRASPIPGRLAEVRVRQARIHLTSRRQDQAIDLLRLAIDDVRDGIDPQLELEAVHLLATSYAHLDKLSEVGRWLERAKPLYERFAPADLLAERARFLGRIALADQRLDDAARHLEESLRMCRDLGAHVDACRALIDLGVVYGRLGRAADVQRVSQDLSRLAAELDRRSRLPGDVRIVDSGDEVHAVEWPDFAPENDWIH